MKVEKLTVFGAMFAAFAASLCCVLPLLFAVLGLGAFGAAAAFATARPFLLGAAALLLAFGFFRAYFRRGGDCAPDMQCAVKPVNRAGRVGLVLASAVALGFALAPYYTGLVARKLLTSNAQTSDAKAAAPAAVAQVKFKITGMTCAGCADTIKAALEKTVGVARAEVSYERGEAIVVYDPKVIAPEKIRDVINQMGYQTEIVK
jgi:copper chaperone CopZ